MGTQEARPRSAGVGEGGTARGRGRCRPGAASGRERRRPPVDPRSRPSAPPGGSGRTTRAAEGGTHSLAPAGSAGVAADAGAKSSSNPSHPQASQNWGGGWGVLGGELSRAGDHCRPTQARVQRHSFAAPPAAPLPGPALTRLAGAPASPLTSWGGRRLPPPSGWFGVPGPTCAAQG